MHGFRWPGLPESSPQACGTVALWTESICLSQEPMDGLPSLVVRLWSSSLHSSAGPRSVFSIHVRPRRIHAWESSCSFSGIDAKQIASATYGHWAVPPHSTLIHRGCLTAWPRVLTFPLCSERPRKSIVSNAYLRGEGPLFVNCNLYHIVSCTLCGSGWSTEF